MLRSVPCASCSPRVPWNLRTDTLPVGQLPPTDPSRRTSARSTVSPPHKDDPFENPPLSSPAWLWMSESLRGWSVVVRGDLEKVWTLGARWLVRVALRLAARSILVQVLWTADWECRRSSGPTKMNSQQNAHGIRRLYQLESRKR